MEVRGEGAGDQGLDYCVRTPIAGGGRRRLGLLGLLCAGLLLFILTTPLQGAYCCHPVSR